MPIKGRGFQITKAGHVRFTSPTKLRNRYEHRVVFERMLEETDEERKALVPDPYEVHHMDFNKAHNCPYNLLALDIVMHSKLTASGRRRDPYTGEFMTKDQWIRRYGMD